MFGSVELGLCWLIYFSSSIAVMGRGIVHAICRVVGLRGGITGIGRCVVSCLLIRLMVVVVCGFGQI